MIKIFKNYQNYFKAIKEDFNTDYLGTLLPEVMYRISKYGKLSECEQAIKKLFSEKNIIINDDKIDDLLEKISGFYMYPILRGYEQKKVF